MKPQASNSKSANAKSGRRSEKPSTQPKPRSRENFVKPEAVSWFVSEVEAITTSLPTVTPSQWAEQNRWLPPSVSAAPGYYSFERAPFTREIVDAMGVDSPVREVSWMKGAQLGATTAVENVVGYVIDFVGSAPMMWVTADSELAKQRLQANILPMIQASGLTHKIKSSDEGNSRKKGQTDQKIEWLGGGSLRPLGAQNANKFRQDSVRFMVRDEIDAWPQIVGKDGDPIQLTTSRTSAFEDVRKIFDASTPLIKGQSNIEKRFRLGDQRYYHIPCLSCGKLQRLKWRREDPTTGEVTGIVWETDETGGLVEGSVRYLCKFCGHAHRNEDKVRMLPEEGFGGRAKWIPSAKSSHKSVRSYHLSSLYSLLQSWESAVRLWLEAWDPETGKPKDMAKLQVFWNNVLGEPFELRGEKLKFEQVSAHRRHAYKFGEVPNKWAAVHAGSPIMVVTCAVDVHGSSLKVAAIGWCKDRRPFLLDYWNLEGQTDQLDNPSTWGELRKIIEQKSYRGDDGKIYGIAVTLIDGGYSGETVHRFCSEYESGVLFVRGRGGTTTALQKLFSEFKEPTGIRSFTISVDQYKDRLAVSLRRGWDGMGMQPIGHFNAPVDATDAQLKELTVEVKTEKIDPRTKQRVGWEWHRPKGSKNELWDLLVYNSCAIDMLAWDYCKNVLQLDQLLWPMFWDYCERGAYFTNGH